MMRRPRGCNNRGAARRVRRGTPADLLRFFPKDGFGGVLLDFQALNAAKIG
jgi:hypothetical protein